MTERCALNFIIDWAESGLEYRKSLIDKEGMDFSEYEYNKGWIFCLKNLIELTRDLQKSLKDNSEMDISKKLNDLIEIVSKQTVEMEVLLRTFGKSNENR